MDIEIEVLGSNFITGKIDKQPIDFIIAKSSITKSFQHKNIYYEFFRKFNSRY